VTNIPDVACTFWYYRFNKWVSGNAYLTGAIVNEFTLTGNFYICIQSIAPSTTVPSADPTHFALITNPLYVVAWDSGVQYTVGSQVAYQQFSYYCILKPPVGGLPTNATYWIQSTNYLNMIRLQPSWMAPELIGTQYGYNRTFTDYTDLVTELNKACAADPIGNPNFSSTTNNVRFTANDIVFTYNSTYNKIVMTGTNSLCLYLPVGYLDDQVFSDDILFAAGQLLQLTTNNIAANTINTFLTGGYIGSGQPYAKGQSLNLRLGWTWAGNYLGEVNFKNLIRPVPPYTIFTTQAVTSFSCSGSQITFTYPTNYKPLAAATCVASGFTSAGVNGTYTITSISQTQIVCNSSLPPSTISSAGILTFSYTQAALTTLQNIAPSYACLVNTASVSIYMDVVGGSSQDSSGAAGILASVPLNAGNNTVGFFDKVLSHSLTKIPAQLQEVRFYMKDEHGNDFYLPNSAVVTLELGVEY
jgi:hypothetical protein